MLINNMKLNLYIYITLCFILSSTCGYSKEAHTEFLERVTIFWEYAISSNCSQLHEMVRYPVLMDGMSIDNKEELNSRCEAIVTSAKYLKKNNSISEGNSTFTIHESGWLKKEIIAGHPLLKNHIGSDVSFFLLEVVSNYTDGQPLTFIFRRDYEDSNGGWDIIMFDDYSLTELMKKK